MFLLNVGVTFADPHTPTATTVDITDERVIADVIVPDPDMPPMSFRGPPHHHSTYRLNALPNVRPGR
jgi:hypothetical protein